jgi:uncharacterized repeat protein (TIGR03809 family)
MKHQLDVARGRDTVARWCALAERRLEYLTELFETGRWRRFHSEIAFLENIQEAKAAVETWRDLLSREASRNNTAIDMSWLGRTRTVLPRGENWRDLAQPAAAKVSAEPPSGISIVPKADPVRAAHAFSRQAMDDNTMDDSTRELTQDVAAIAERYPLLRNTL